MDAKIKSTFYSDSRVENLDAAQKFSLLWALTQTGRDLLGFSTVTHRRFIFETSLPDLTPLLTACQALPTSFQIILPTDTPSTLQAPSTPLPSHFPSTSHPQAPFKPLPPPSSFIVFCRNFLRHQFGKGGTLNLRNHVITSVIRTAATLPGTLQQAFIEAYPELKDPILETLLNNLPNPNQNQAPPTSPPPYPQGEREEKSREEKSIDSSSSPLPDPHPIPKGETPDAQAEIDHCALLLAGLPPEDPAPIAELILGQYPRRERIANALTILLDQLRRRQIDPLRALLGTRSAAAFIRTIPSAEQNRYLPNAETYFRDKRWQDDPSTLHRPPQTTGGPNGKPIRTQAEVAAALGRRAR